MQLKRKNEFWKDIPGYEGIYQVSNYGRVKSLDRTIEKTNGEVHHLTGKILNINVRKDDGTNLVYLWKNNKGHTFLLHRLVASCFIPNPENKPEINHIDGNRSNNSVTNLEWVTRSENMLHNYRVLGRVSSGGVKRKMVECVETGIIYESLSDAARKNGVSQNAIGVCVRNIPLKNGARRVCLGKHWRYV